MLPENKNELLFKILIKLKVLTNEEKEEKINKKSSEKRNVTFWEKMPSPKGLAETKEEENTLKH